jgi:hypothetical protein
MHNWIGAFMFNSIHILVCNIIISHLFYLVRCAGGQGIVHEIIVFRQSAKGLFNKGRLLNTATKWIKESSQYNDLCYHDIDFVPLNNFTDYGDFEHVRQPIRSIECRNTPTYFSGGIICMNITSAYHIGGIRLYI